MVKSAVLFLQVPHLAAMRVSNNEELDQELVLPDAYGVQQFICPSECVECCKQMSSLSGLVGGYYQQRDTFKCITRAEDNVTSIPDRRCDDPRPRFSVSYEMKRVCHFTYPERRGEAWRNLENCRDTSVRTYEDFLGHDSCSLSRTGKLFSRATGLRMFGFGRAGVDALFLTNNHAIAGGVCNTVGSTFANGGLLAPGMTEEQAQNTLCEGIEEDLQSKRMDPFTMGVWAATVGPLNPWNITRASSGTQILQKFEIPGWPARLATSEAPKDDMKPIDLVGGLLQCTMLRLRGLSLDDDMAADENNWGPGCEDSTAVHYKYYDRWGLYQRPWNFDVPQNERLSDRILQQLVFQNIGSHRLELINDLDGHDASFINPIGLGGCGNGPIPVIGCPFPLISALSAIPERVRRSVKFAVRQEGLFDDVPRRSGLGKWGGNAFFDGEGNILALQYEGRTLVAGEGDGDWDYFKFVFRSTLVSSITAFDHLVGTHIIVAQTLAVAATENLAPDNELRMMIQPHIVGTLNINFNAALNLFPQGLLIHRASPFDNAAFQGEDERGTGVLWAKTVVLRYTKFESVYRTYRQFLEELRSEDLQMPELPFFEDGLLIFNEIRRYVDSAIDLIYGSRNFVCSHFLRSDVEAQRFMTQFWALSDPATPDFWPQEFREAGSDCNSLKSLLTEVIFLVTGWHRHVGTVADFFRDTRFASTMWKDGESDTRPKQATMMMLLAAATNAILPKLSHELSEQIYGDHESLAENFRALNSGMLEVQSQIEQRNEIRQRQNFVPYHQMEPNSVEWGVQV